MSNIQLIKKIYPDICKNISDKDIQHFIDSIFKESDSLFSTITREYLQNKQSSFNKKQNQYSTT